MKRLLALLLLSQCFFMRIQAQEKQTFSPCTDTLTQSGYIFELVTHNEKAFKKFRKQSSKLAQKGMHKLGIDYFQKFYFVKGKLSDSGVELSQRLGTLINKSNDSVFTFCPFISDTEHPLLAGGVTRGVALEGGECIFPFLDSELYCRVRGLKGYLFKVYFVEAEWHVFKLPSHQITDYLNDHFPVGSIAEQNKPFSFLHANKVLSLESELVFDSGITALSANHGF